MCVCVWLSESGSLALFKVERVSQETKERVLSDEPEFINSIFMFSIAGLKYAAV